MIEHLSKLGFPLHEQLGKDAILNSLPKSYLPFLTHFRMTKPAVNYHGLLGLLQNFEKDHQLHKESVNIVGGSSSSRRSFKKGRRTRRIRRCSRMLGCLHRVRPRSTSPTRARQSASFTRSRGTGRGTVLYTLPHWIRTGQRRSKRFGALLLACHPRRWGWGR